MTACRLLRSLVLLALLVPAACTDQTEDEVRGYATLFLGQEGSAARAASDRLVGYGRRALPTIESALHTATPANRRRLVGVMRRIAAPEAVPLVAHLAAYDPAPEVALEAAQTLRAWVTSGPPTLAERARAALRTVEELRKEEAAG
jgi:hypothetical protein